jgi:transcriptional regulator GlxA family with amidase domain
MTRLINETSEKIYPVSASLGGRDHLDNSSRKLATARVGKMTKMRYFLPMRRRIVLVVYPGFELLDLAGPASVFRSANFSLAKEGKPPFYSVDIVSAKGGTVASNSGVAVETCKLAEQSPEDVHTFLIAGGEADTVLAAIADPSLRRCVPRYVAAAARFGSVCSGVFILAALGLVNGKRVATHWDACAPFANGFPSVVVDPDALYVVDDRLWTSAGVSTGIDMALAMVARDLDATIAGQVAKRLVLYAWRPGYQSQFSPILQAQAKADSPFAELIAWMHANLRRSLDVPSLAARAGLGERTFYRKFLAATGESPAHFVETIRVDAARMLLSRGLPLKAVATQVGLAPAARLTEAFERRFGVTPSLFREMHADL